MDFPVNLFENTGFVSFGVIRYDRLLTVMSERQKERAQLLCPGAASVYARFFLISPAKKGHISKYARGRDYHAVLKEALGEVCLKLSKAHPNNAFIRSWTRRPCLKRRRHIFPAPAGSA
jgi:epoxyqueuosine reductase